VKGEKPGVAAVLCERRVTKSGRSGNFSMLEKWHLAVGFLFLLIFLATGAYMFFGFPDLYQGREEIRMMYRASHIYILFAGSVNLLMAGGLNSYNNWLASVQMLASIAVLLAPVLILVGFIIEPPSYLVERTFTFWGIVFLFSGVLLRSLLHLSWAKGHAMPRSNQ